MKQWYDVHHPNIKENTISVSKDGKIRDNYGEHNPLYLSSNGYLYEQIKDPNDNLVLFPFDVIMAFTFLPIPSTFLGTKVTVNHKNDILADCNIDNLEWVEDVEEWKMITYPNVKTGSYQISNHGRINSLIGNQPRIMKTEIDEYERIQLITINGEKKHFSVHRLVAFEFLPGYGPDKQVNHINSNKSDNHVRNLEWVTSSMNRLHAYYTNMSDEDQMSENDVMLICKALNYNNGGIMAAFNDVKNMVHGVTYSMISLIKYGIIKKDISSKYLTTAGRHKQIRQTDPDVILVAAQCLKKHNGDVKKTKKELEKEFPWVSYSWLWHLKDKSVASETTDLVFSKDEFPKTIPLTENDVMIIINSLLAHKGDPYANHVVFNELKDKIPGLTKDKIRAIKEKKSWKTLSDKYFTKNDFI